MNNAVTVAYGADAIKGVYDRALEEKVVDFRCMASNYDQVMGGYYDENIEPKLYDGSISTREILPETDDGESPRSASNQVRRTKAPRSESDMIVAETWGAWISFDSQDPLVILVEDREMVKMMRSQFEVEWKSLGN